MVKKKAPAKHAAGTGVPAVPKPKGKPRNAKNVIPVGDKNIAVYASPRVAKAMDEITEDMTLYHGVRFTQILEAVYNQGKKDGARNVFGEWEKQMKMLQKSIPHRNPGQPKKSK